MRSNRFAFAAGALALAASALTMGARAQQRSAQFFIEPLSDAKGQVGLGLALRKLTTVGTFMHTTGHAAPDRNRRRADPHGLGDAQFRGVPRGGGSDEVPGAAAAGSQAMAGQKAVSARRRRFRPIRRPRRTRRAGRPRWARWAAFARGPGFRGPSRRPGGCGGASPRRGGSPPPPPPPSPPPKTHRGPPPPP